MEENKTNEISLKKFILYFTGTKTLKEAASALELNEHTLYAYVSGANPIPFDFFKKLKLVLSLPFLNSPDTVKRLVKIIVGHYSIFASSDVLSKESDTMIRSLLYLYLGLTWPYPIEGQAEEIEDYLRQKMEESVVVGDKIEEFITNLEWNPRFRKEYDEFTPYIKSRLRPFIASFLTEKRIREAAKQDNEIIFSQLLYEKYQEMVDGGFKDDLFLSRAFRHDLFKLIEPYLYYVVGQHECKTEEEIFKELEKNEEIPEEYRNRNKEKHSLGAKGFGEILGIKS